MDETLELTTEQQQQSESRVIHRLWLGLWRSLALYAVFLLPTVVWTVLIAPQASQSGHSERWLWDSLVDAWTCSVWHLPGLPAKTSNVVLDILRVILVIGLGWEFVQCYRQLSSLKTLTVKAQHTVHKISLLWLFLATILLVPVIPFHSSDLYGYLNRGFQQSLLQTNPYLTPIAEISNWEQYAFFQPHWIYNPCPYGFAFAGLVKQLTAIAHSFGFSVLLFKLLNASVLILLAQLITRCSIAFNQSRPWLTYLAFVANPLVLLHTVGNGHNDILMTLPLLAALFMALKVNGLSKVFALPSLILSILVKYISALAAPLLFIYCVRQRQWMAFWGGSLFSVMLIAMLAAPYVPHPHQHWRWSDMLDNAGKPQHSFISMFSEMFFFLPGESELSILKLLFLLGFVVFYCKLMLTQWRASESEQELTLLENVTTAMIVLVAMVSAKFHPWYILMFLPLALLLHEEHKFRRFAMLFALFQLAGFSFIQNIPVLNVLLLTLTPLWLIFSTRSPTMQQTLKRLTGF